MKRCIKIGIFVCLLLLLSIQASANDVNELTSAAEELYESVPSEFYDLAGDIDSALNFTNFIRSLFKSIAEAFLKNKSGYASLFFLVIVVFVCESVFSSFEWKLSKYTNTVILLIFGINFFGIISSVLKSFVASHAQISEFISAASTVSVGALALSSSANSAALFGTECTVLIQIYNFLCSNIVIPFAVLYMALALCGGIVGGFNIRRISSFTRNTLIGIIGVSMSLFCGVMSVQSVIVMSKDSLLKRTLKQALSSGLPVLGGAVAEGMDTLFTAVVSIKNHVGLLGISVSVILSLSPVSELLLCFIVLTIICFMLSFFEDAPLYTFLNAIRDMISVLICVTLSLTVMIFLLFYFIIRIT